MKKILLTCFSLILIISIYSCRKENVNPVLILFPNELQIEVTSGQVISFKIEARSDNNELSRLTITSKRDNAFTTTAFDSLVSGKSLKYTYEMQVANSTGPYSLLLTFRITDNDGNTSELLRVLNVTAGAVTLTETSGHTFYSKASGTHPEYAFDLKNKIPVIGTIDSIFRDLQDNPQFANSDTLSRSWKSPANGRFVRFPGYDYANATDQSLINAYNSGIPFDLINQITVGEIILTKLGSQPDSIPIYAVIKIMEVSDGPGADNDKYVFNMKWHKKQ